MALYAAALTLFDRYEKEPIGLMVAVFVWGAIVAAGSSMVLNTAFGLTLLVASGSEGLSSLATGVISAPIVEEAVKGLAVVAVFLYFRHEFDSVLDGVIYGSLVGFGFAAAENIAYIYRGFLGGGWEGLAFLVFVRAILIAFLHATFTSLTGIGLALARLNGGAWRIAGPIGGYLAAVAAHAFHNLLGSFGSPLLCLLGSALDWLGFLAMFGFILYLVYREGRVMREHLLDEVRLGHLTQAQYNAACSITGQAQARWTALTGGRGRASNRFYDLCGELAFKKHHLTRLGATAEPDAQAVIERLRQQLGDLRSQA
jgi:RsiW-degrading membrane proteinase PrsW (M82 family)